MNPDVLKAALERDEGRVAVMYLDTKGKVTIGIGHNLTDKPLSQRAIDVLYEDDMAECVVDLTTHFPWFNSLDEVRQHVVLNMRFQLGPKGFRGFKNTLAAIAAGNYEDAARRMKESLWAEQVPKRANRLAEEMRTGAVHA